MADTAPVTEDHEPVKPICCFHMRSQGCTMPANAWDKVCPHRHADDDGTTPCNFGATCRIGHAKRVLPTSREEVAAFWDRFNATGAHVGKNPASRDATLLRSQLEPWSTVTLRLRWEEYFGGPPASAEVPRADVMQALLDGYAQGGDYARRTVRVTGTPVPEDLLAEIMSELVLWSSKHLQNDRPSISASSYTILRSPMEFSSKDSNNARKAATKLRKHARLWDLAMQALSAVDEEFAKSFSALALTKNFSGSPHIDNQNAGPFYGLSLGSFPDGQGGVCVECDPFLVAHVNTRNRLAKVDGRFPHWVAPYDTAHDRYSLIYYRTDGDREVPTRAVFAEFD